MDLNLMNFLIIILSIISLGVLGYVLKKTKKDNFIVTMLVMAMSIVGHLLLFSVIRVYSFLFNIASDVPFLNWWSIFIKMHTLAAITWIGISALKRIRK